MMTIDRRAFAKAALTARFALFTMGCFGALGCSSVGSSAVRTDGLMPRSNVGQVRLYAITPPPNVRFIGVVEVHAVNEEANIETLMPTFLRRVAELGGSGGVIDHVDTRWEYRTDYRTETYTFSCGYHGTCVGSRVVPMTYILRELRIRGRAVVPADLPANRPASAPADAPNSPRPPTPPGPWVAPPPPNATPRTTVPPASPRPPPSQDEGTAI